MKGTSATNPANLSAGDVDDFKTPGALLRVARERSGLSQRALAARAGIARTTVERIETDGTDADPRWSTMQRLLASAGQRLVMMSVSDGPFTGEVWHEELRDGAGRHFPAHLPLTKVCDPLRDWSQGWRYSTWIRPPAPAYSYWRRPIPPLQPHLLKLKLWRHGKARCHCAYLQRRESQFGQREPP